MLLFDYITLTTSQKQGRRREVGSGGSLRQTCELTYRNLIVKAEFPRQASTTSRSPLRIQGIR